MKKRILTLALVLILSLALSVSAFAAQSKTLTNFDGRNITLSNITAQKSLPVSEVKNWVDGIPAEDWKLWESVYGNEGMPVFYGSAPVTLDASKGIRGWNCWLEDTVSASSIKRSGESQDGTWYYAKLKFTESGRYFVNIYTYRGTALAFYLVIGEEDASTTPTNQKPTATTEKPTAQKPATPNTPAPSAPSDKNIVKVAGQDRTLGQIQTHSSGGYLYTVDRGDTLYDISKRFYGNGNLWKELQKVNQEWLNGTKDGIIFAGFNLLLPSELGDVRANIE